MSNRSINQLTLTDTPASNDFLITQRGNVNYRISASNLLGSGALDGVFNLLGLGTPQARTIADGEIDPDKSYVVVTSQGGSGTDDLDTIALKDAGTFLLLQVATGSTVTLTDADNIVIPDATDLELLQTECVLLFCNGTGWYALKSTGGGGGYDPANVAITGGTITGVAITGDTIDGVPIGGSTPAAGAFTTLSASGAVTLTSGTINGIAIGGSTPAAGAFTTLSASGAVTFTSGTINGIPIGGSTPAAGAFTTLSASDDFAVDTNVLFVDVSTNRTGFNVSSPLSNVHVRGDALRVDKDDSTATVYMYRYSSSYAAIYKGFSLVVEGSSSNDGYFSINDMGISSGGGGTERLRISNDGYVGINQSAPARLFTNYDADVQNESFHGVDGDGLIWATDALGYTAAFYNATDNSIAHGVLIKTTNTASDALTINIAGNDRFHFDGSGNFIMRGDEVGTGAGGVLSIRIGSPPTSSPTNICQLYVEDVSSSAELKVRDEAGNVTVLSPHSSPDLINPDPDEDLYWNYRSMNAFTGIEMQVDMIAALREIERLSGKTLIYTREHEPDDWHANQRNAVKRSKAKIAKWQATPIEQREGDAPELHKIKEPPAYIKRVLERKQANGK